MRVAGAKVALSTASTYPESTAAAFEMAARLGYDGVEVMVWTDPVSQDVDALRRLSDYHGIPILAIHAPCLLITQRVWGTDPWAKLQRRRRPPPRRSARARSSCTRRSGGSASTRATSSTASSGWPTRPTCGSPWRTCSRCARAAARSCPTRPTGTRSSDDYRHVTLDLSHTSVSQSDAMAMAIEAGDRLAHVHLADGMGTARDEHLVPGRGTQPCAELLEHLATVDFDGVVVVEINTRRSESRADREADLAEALAYTRLHLARATRRRLRTLRHATRSQVVRGIERIATRSRFVRRGGGRPAAPSVGRTAVLRRVLVGLAQPVAHARAHRAAVARRRTPVRRRRDGRRRGRRHARSCVGAGLTVSLDHLGEDTLDAAQATAVTKAYLELLGRAGRRRADRAAPRCR